MKRLAVAAGACLLLIAVAVPVLSVRRDSVVSETPLVRAVQRNGPWVESCGGDTCVGTVTEPLILNPPPGTTTFDVIITLTLDFRTSPKDIGLVQMKHKTRGGPSGLLSPRTYPLTSTTRTSTTLTWSIKDVSWDGDRHLFYPLLDVENRGERFAYSFEGRHMLLVAEAWV